MKVEFILVEDKNEEEQILTPIMSITNPTVRPVKGEFINIYDNRFQVTGVEWLLLREQVNIYVARVK